jgi:hypothetical protein
MSEVQAVLEAAVVPVSPQRRRPGRAARATSWSARRSRRPGSREPSRCGRTRRSRRSARGGRRRQPAAGTRRSTRSPGSRARRR